MSIITTPKIPKNFDHIEDRKTWHFGGAKFVASRPIRKPVKKKVLRLVTWNKSQLDLLVELRVLKCTMEKCGEILGRSAGSCCGAIQTHDLYTVITDKRKLLIQKALDEYDSAKNSQDQEVGQY